MAQRASVHWMENLSAHVPLQINHEIICPPKIMASGNSSCTHSCVEGSAPGLDLEGILELLRWKRFVLLYDCPDNGSPMKRRQAFIRKSLSGEPGAFVSTSNCAAHSVHRCIVQSLDEKQLLGDIHAVAFICSQQGYREMLHRALKDVLSNIEVRWGLMGIDVD